VVPLNADERKFNLQFDLSSARQSDSPKELEVIPEGCGSSDAMSREIVQLLNEQVGILSLTRVRDSLLMWSHFGAQYAGAVVGFDSAHDFFAHQIDVEYRSLRPRRHISSYLAGKPVSLAELCAKSNHWAYEEEVRVIRKLAEFPLIGTRRFPGLGTT
jgi:hypothetical protein